MVMSLYHKLSLTYFGPTKGRTIILLSGGLPFLGLPDNFFQKSNAFQTIFFITFCDENNFYDHF